MTTSPKTDRMLARVRRRLYVARLVRTFLITLCWAGVAAAVLLPAAWFLEGVGPTVTLLAVPAAVLVAALLAPILTRRPAHDEAARAADAAAGTKDLFLTTVRLAAGAGVGDYAPLVDRDAEGAAGRVDPKAAVAIPFERPALWAGAGLVAATVAALLVPQFDPFGTEAQAKEDDQRRKLAAAGREATETRQAELKKAQPEKELSPEVEKEIEDLKLALRQLKPNAPDENRRKLGERQKELGEEWRKAAAESLKDSLAKNAEGQRLGSGETEQLRKWTKELQQGSTESLKKELDEMKQELEQLAKAEDPAERAERLQKLEERLKRMEKFAKEGAGSKPLAAALKRAAEQLAAAREAGNKKELSTEAMESLKKSLDLSEMELQEMAQTARDLKELEKALETLQAAKKASDENRLSEGDCEDCFTLEDYRELYQEMLAQGRGGEGNGEGLGGEGMGRGGKAPEDDSVASGFKTEKSQTAITAGKILLSLQAKGLSDSGEAQRDYRERAEEVQQGVSEAILQEQVPPGYHESIKKYFDTLKPADEQPPAP